MSQQHLDRLSSVDAGFLHQEDNSSAHMHIGGLTVFAGPAPSENELLAHVESRLPLIPRFRQKVRYPPLGTGRPLWVDDPSFNLRYHVRRTALPSPGGEEQLHQLISRVFSQRLDRSKPLWEMWVIEGLDASISGVPAASENRRANDGFGMLVKTHHALVDGVGGIDIMTALLDLTEEPMEVPSELWQPSANPTSPELLLHGAGDVVRGTARLSARGIASAVHPRRTANQLRDRGEGLVEVAKHFVVGAPPSMLNRSPGPHRTVVTVEHQLTEYRAIRQAYGATINDVVLAVVAGALRQYLSEHGEHVNRHPLRAMVPVSVRPDSSEAEMGNQIVVMVCPLPTDVADPADRLTTVMREMSALKQSSQAIGARTLMDVESFAPPSVLAQASRLGFSSRLFNLLVTNVPGPQVPVYFLGHELRHVYPVAFLAPAHTLAVAILSYYGRLGIGLIADADALPDVDQLTKAINAALQELRATV
jgi:diacylglycerol O-acyltransferase